MLTFISLGVVLTDKITSTSERPVKLRLRIRLRWVSEDSYNPPHRLTSFLDPNTLQGRLLFAIPKKGALPSGFHTHLADRCRSKVVFTINA